MNEIKYTDSDIINQIISFINITISNNCSSSLGTFELKGYDIRIEMEKQNIQ